MTGSPFADIPASVRLSTPPALPGALSEPELLSALEAAGGKNAAAPLHN